MALQLVENEDMIGVLIETNDRIIAALESYDMVSKHVGPTFPSLTLSTAFEA